MPYLSIFFSVFILCGVGVVFYIFSRKALKKKIIEELELKLFLVRLPRESVEGRDIKQEIAKTEQLITTLASFKKPFIFEVAVPYIGQEIHFYVAVPGMMSDAFIKQIHSLWNDSDVERVEDYNIFNYHGAVVGAWLKQKEFFGLPIKTYQESNSDSFAPMLGGLLKINEIGEGGAIQFVISPTDKQYVKEAKFTVSEVRKGKNLKDAVSPSVIEETVNTFISALGEKKKEDDAEKKNKLPNEELIKTLESKLSKQFFKVNVRILASAPSEYQAGAILEGITAGFFQFSSPNRNELKIIKPKNIETIVSEFSFREFDAKNALILNSEEFASIFHFPTPFTETPKIKQLKFKEVAPPANLPKEGIVLGENRYRNEVTPVRFTREDRRRHLYIVGQTGTGKSVLLNNLSSQDIQKGEGICVIDPNGDLSNDILGKIPKNRLRDVIVFDPSDIERPLGLNMLEYDPAFPEQKTFIVNEMLNIFDTLYDLKTTGGPMFEQYMRNSLLLLMDDPTNGFTILEVPRILSDAPFRKQLLLKCRNIIVKDFWEKEAEKAGGEASLANMVPYITSKFNTFIANDYVRPIIAQSKSTLNFRKIMDEGKILLVNLSKGRIGDLNAGLLGMIIVGKLTLAAFSRDDTPIERRRDFYLYIDEFQNFTTPSISTILSEARKYRLCLTVAHQFIAQLKDPIRDAIFGNVGSLVAFRVGPNDAEFLEKQFNPVFNENNLVNIDNLNAHVKLMIEGQVVSPFILFVPFPEKGTRENIQNVKELSRMLYGKPREDVENEAYTRLRS